MNKRYQIFVSSTFKDLEKERETVMRTILELGHFPSGMELFPSANDSQWEFIKKVINECDYYIVIIAGMYGTVNPNTKLSYTEMEYRYAVNEAKKPVLAFLPNDIENLPNKYVDSSVKKRKSLERFKDFVKTKLVNFYQNSDDLGRKIATSLPKLILDNPSQGWIKYEDYSETELESNTDLASYIKHHEGKSVFKPYREDLVAEVAYEEFDENNFLVKDKVSYISKNVGEKLHEDLSWGADPEEFIEVKKLIIEVKPPVGHKRSGKTHTLFNGNINSAQCEKGFEIIEKIPIELNAKGLRVTFDTEYLINKNRFNYWIMGLPTKGFTLTLTYPTTYHVQVVPFVQILEAVDLTSNRNGYYKFRYDEWILPDDGLAWIFYKKAQERK